MKCFPSTTRLRRLTFLYLGFTGGLLLSASRPPAAYAHVGDPPTPETIWSSWNVEPFIVLTLVLALWPYLRGVRALWGKAGRNRGISYAQVAAGIGGFVTLIVALISPLDPLSSALFSAHMVQHLLLIAIAAPLFVIADMGIAYLWSVPKSWRRRIPGVQRKVDAWRVAWVLVTLPLPIWLLHSVALWGWHAPSFYRAALESDVIHAAEHATLFGTALLFWWFALRRGRRAGSGYGLGLLGLFGMVIQGTALGALITFSSGPWYPEYATSATTWGLTPLDDQQLAGAVMLVPGGIVYVAAGLLLFANWLSAIERSVDRREQLKATSTTPQTTTDRRLKETV